MLKSFLSTILLISIYTGIAQTEGAVWSSIKFQKDLGEKFQIALEPQLRFTDGDLEKRFIETSVEYQPVKYFGVEVIHRYSKETTKNGWYNSHRMAFDFNGQMELNRWEPGVRFRYTNMDNFNEEGGSNFLRYKVKLGYDIRNFKLNPEISAETFYLTQGNTLRKVRYEIGTSYKISKTHSISVAYKRDDFATKSKFVNIVDIGYRIKL